MSARPEEGERFAAVLEQFATGYRTVGEKVLEVLRQAIVNGSFAPGEWLRQQHLAKAIGVSRIPVRTALLQLEREGLVVMHPHRGAQVKPQMVDQIDEIYALRLSLETYALSHSMARMGPERLLKLQALADRLDGQPGGQDFLRTRTEFYREVYDSETNPILADQIDYLRSLLGSYLMGFRFNQHESTRHGLLVERIAAGDLAGAESWLRHHLEEVREGIIRVSDAGRQSPISEPGLIAEDVGSRTVSLHDRGRARTSSVPSRRGSSQVREASQAPADRQIWTDLPPGG